MISHLLLSISIIAQPMDLGTIQDECTKTDGVQPSRCEMVLASELFDFGQALQNCAAAHKEAEAKNEKLVDLMLNQPAPEQTSSFSLFGLPDWATGLIVGGLVTTALAGGIAIGVNL